MLSPLLIMVVLQIFERVPQDPLRCDSVHFRITH
uniref:Uncharacterized protein n=1 Tax=Arundo donax TaxID=35708 RepID=A0A0A9A7Y6_ARUDO